MKKLLFICFIVISIYNANSQSLSLNEMFTICNKSNWSEVNEYLLRKGWDYYESSKGDNEHYNTITWALEKDYNNSAQGWFYLYTFEELPNKVRYSFSNKNTYNNIKTGITSSGMKQIESNIEDNAIQTKYANANYIVNITIEKRQRNDYEESSVTAYSVTVIKKSGVFDNDNGLKTHYDDNGNKDSEYYLKDGKINGIAKSYFPNGQVKVISNFINGNKNGISKEYDENGNQTYEFTYANNELNGFFKVFENGKLSMTGTLINGEKNGLFKVYDSEARLDKEYEMKTGVLNGKYVEYYYSKDEGKLVLKQTGQYIDDEKNGLWQIVKFKEKGSTLLSSINFNKGIKEGKFKDVRNDSIIFGTYKNGMLNGDYIVYTSFISKLLGEVSGDTIGAILICKGEYYQDKKSGHWKYYSFSSKKSVVREGNYYNDLENGEWRYYFPDYADDNGKPLFYSGKLFLVQSFNNGNLDGKAVRYASLNKQMIKCDSTTNKNPLDTCYNTVFEKQLETAYYKNGKLYGPYELKDSLNRVLFKGNFINDEKDGYWLESYTRKDIDEKPYYLCYRGNYKAGKRTGIWEEFVKEDFIFTRYRYEDGELNGKTVSYKENKIVHEEKIFENGYLKDLVVYDSLGVKVKNHYEILSENSNSLKCRKTEFSPDGKASLVYTIKKDSPEPIDHDFFEFYFLIKTGKYSDGSQGYPDGELIFYNDKNQIITKGELFKKVKTGKWYHYFYDKGVYNIQEFNNDIAGVETFYEISSNQLYSGKFIQTYDNGEIESEFKISDGLRNGKSIYYDESGKEIKIEKYKKGVLQN